MTQLTEHFSLEEFLRSDAAVRLGDRNWPTKAHRANLLVLARGMERVRAALGRPIYVTSGYRNPAVNKAVGGVSDSDHALGFACDFPTTDARGDTDKIVGASIGFDQLIHETGRQILHISFNRRMRHQLLTQVSAAGTPFTWGIA